LIARRSGAVQLPGRRSGRHRSAERAAPTLQDEEILLTSFGLFVRTPADDEGGPMSDRFRRTLPSHPHLDQQKTLAKELLRAFRAGDAEALARVRERLPDKSRITLSDAQYVLAGEYGFEGWKELRRHILDAGRSEEVPREAFRAAIGARDATRVRRLLERHAELRAAIDDPVFSFDSPALVHVAGSGDLALIETLLEFGADPNRRSEWWAGPFHPLHLARGPVADRLIAAGAEVDTCAAAGLNRVAMLAEMIERNPDCVHERGGDGQTPLHFAQSREVVDLLLEAGADIDARDIDHRATPAQWMLDRTRGRGRYGLASYLAERGATTDIFLAAALGLEERVRDLLSADPTLLDLRTTRGDYGGKSPSSVHIYMWTLGPELLPLQVAAQFGQEAVVRVMRDFAVPRQRLLAALTSGDEEEAHALIRAEPNLMDDLGSENHHLLPDAGWAGNARAVRLLLDLGFDPRTTNAGGATALHNAAFQGAADCVAALLRHPVGAEALRILDHEHRGTPIGWCFFGSRHGPKGDHPTVARLLRGAGGQPHPNDFPDPTPEVRRAFQIPG